MECPVCGGPNYQADDGLDEERAPVEPPSGFCEDCYYLWKWTPTDPADWILSLREDIIPAMEAELPKYKAIVAKWDKEHPDHGR